MNYLMQNLFIWSFIVRKPLGGLEGEYCVCSPPALPPSSYQHRVLDWLPKLPPDPMELLFSFSQVHTPNINAILWLPAIGRQGPLPAIRQNRATFFWCSLQSVQIHSGQCCSSICSGAQEALLVALLLTPLYDFFIKNANSNLSNLLQVLELATKGYKAIAVVSPEMIFHWKSV